MKREIIFAIIIGLVVGLIITFGVYRAQQAMHTGTSINSTITTSTSASPIPAASGSVQVDAFIVTEPQDESLTSQGSIRTSGQTVANSAIVIINGSSETVTTSDDKGNFSIDVPLNAGANILTIRSLGLSYDPREVIRTVVYSTADMMSTTPISPSPIATASAKKTTLKNPTPTPKGGTQ